MTEKGRREVYVKGKSQRILIVEDDEGLSSLIAKYLIRAGFDVAVANSGAQAVDRITSDPPHLILLDYKLGDMFATQVVNVLKERQYKIPFIIMTGHGDEKLAVEMMKAGARDYIAKEGEFFTLLPSVAKRVFDELRNEEKLAQTDKVLEESERKYRTLIQTIPDIIYKVDLNGYFTFVNSSVKQLGYEPEWLIGKHFTEIIHPEYIKYSSRFFVSHNSANKVIGGKNSPNLFDERRNKNRMVRNLEIRLISKIQKGESNMKKTEGPVTIFCEVMATGDYELDVNTDRKKLIGTLGIIRNISEKIRLQAENVRAGQLAMIGELAAGAAHEINNPIYGIINYAQLIADESNKDSRAYKFSSLIKEESYRIAEIMKNLLSLSRSKTNEKEPVHIYNLIFNSLKLTKVQLERDKIIIKDNIPKDMPAVIANPQEIHQVFLNLVQNARYALNEKYPGKHKNKILKISCENVFIDGLPYIRIIFYDQGLGIPEDILNKVTYPFFTSKPPARGTGLGLSISQNIINNHHDGKMTIESIEGEFTRIIIDLPAAE